MQGSEGTGRSHKWVVVLGSGVLETFAARTLQLEGGNELSASLDSLYVLFRHRKIAGTLSFIPMSAAPVKTLDPNGLGETSGKTMLLNSKLPHICGLLSYDPYLLM